jgi:hypothetical protein
VAEAEEEVQEEENERRLHCAYTALK